jgi:hypothetical protein
MSCSKTTTFRTYRPGGKRTRLAQRALYVVALCFFSTTSWATTIDGKVTNRTTGEPARDDEVILYRVSRSMHEEARARTSEHGDFHFDSRTGLRHLVAVRHQNVAYHTKTVSDGSRVEVRTSAEGTADGSEIEASLPDSLPEGSSNQGFFADTTRTVFLCFETPIVVIALVIVIAICRNRGDISTRKCEQQDGMQTAGLGRTSRDR